MKQKNHVWLSALFIAAAGVFFALFFTMFRPYVVLSGSMEPAIKTGSVCLVNIRADYADVREGDVIAFKSSTGMPVTHRAIAVSEDGVETKGDANDVSDGITTTEANYIGKTLGAVPYLGYAVMFLKTKRGLILLLTIVAAVILLLFLPPREKEEKERPV